MMPGFHLFGPWARSSFVIVVAIGAAACGKSESESPFRKVEMLDLIATLPQGEVRAEDLHVLTMPVSVGGDERASLYMHPPARVSYPPVRMTLQSRLDLSFGINEKIWSEGGDGVQFSVYARPAGREEVRIFSAYLDPKHEERDRRWMDAVVTLGVYAGQDVALVLETDPGPGGNVGWDWAAWSRATLLRGSE